MAQAMKMGFNDIYLIKSIWSLRKQQPCALNGGPSD